MHHLLSRVVGMAAPLAGGRFLYYLATFCGMVMLSYLGGQALAASALISAIQTFLVVVSLSPLFVCSAIIGRHYAAEEYVEVGHIVRQASWLAICISIPLMFLFYHAEVIFIALGQDPVIAKIAAQFSRVYTVGVIPLTLTTVIQQFFIGINRQKFTLYTSLLNLTIFGITAHALIFGAFGIPGLGVSGMAWSNVIAFGFNFIFLFYYAVRDPQYSKYRIWKNDFSQTHYLKQILKIGFPFTIQVSAELSAYFFAVIIVGWLGHEALSITQILTQYSFLLIIPIFGLSQATAVLVSHAVGHKNFQELQPLVKLCLSLGCGIILVCAILFIFFPELLASVFFDVHAPDKHDMFALLKVLFVLKMIDLCFDSIRNILTGALRGIYDTKTPMIMGLIANWVFGVPLGYCLAIPLHMGVIGIYMSFTLGNSLSAFILYKRWKKQIALHTFGE